MAKSNRKTLKETQSNAQLTSTLSTKKLMDLFTYTTNLITFIKITVDMSNQEIMINLLVSISKSTGFQIVIQSLRLKTSGRIKS